jgi:hypothetical protein
MAAGSAVFGFAWLWFLVWRDTGHSDELGERLLWYAPAPLWGATVAVAAVYFGVVRGLVLGVVAAVSGLLGGLVGLLTLIAIHGTGA